jgi:hypothetical protein
MEGVGEARPFCFMRRSATKSGRDLDSRVVRALSAGDWGGLGLVSEGGSLEVDRSNSGGAMGLEGPEKDAWVVVGDKAASVKEIGRDCWSSTARILGEKGSETLWECSSDISEGPAVAVLEG